MIESRCVTSNRRVSKDSARHVALQPTVRDAILLNRPHYMKNIFRKIIVGILQAEAKLVLKKYKPHVVAVTGSVGKTSTKDAIYSVLAEIEHVRKSDKSFNSEIGLPLTILGCPNAWNNPFRWAQNILDGLFLIFVPSDYPRWLVLEVGADKPGDISSLASWLPVDVAVITRLPEIPVHVEFFASPDDVVAEKASLISALKKGGALVIYADDQHVDMLRQKANEREATVYTFGLSSAADVRAEDFEVLFEHEHESNRDARWPIGMQTKLIMGETSTPVSVVGILGTHVLLSVIAAAAVGLALKIATPDIVKGLANYEPPKGRMRILRGIKNTFLIDDTYNSSPAAVEAALNALPLIKIKGRKIAVLGDMLELGKHSFNEHKKIGALAAKRADLLVTVGLRARDIAQGALGQGLPDSAIFQFEDSQKAGDELRSMIMPDDCILVKGSQSIRTEKIVEQLMLEPEKAIDLLVRQETDWKKR